MDLPVKRQINTLMDDTLVSTISRLSAYLRKQVGFNRKMHNQCCSSHGAIRWFSMVTVVNWLIKQRNDVHDLLGRKNTACKLEAYSWPPLFFLKAFLESVHEKMTKTRKIRFCERNDASFARFRWQIAQHKRRLRK